MADIQVKCQNCGAEITVSEFADISMVNCRTCGGKVRLQANQPEPQPAGKVAGEPPQPDRKMRLRPTAETSAASEQPSSLGLPPGPLPKPAKRKHRRFAVRHDMIAWAIFVVVGGVMAWLRYGGALAPSLRGLLTEYAPFAVLALHIAIILKAFKDSLFQGVLCLLVPFYSLYYLLMISEDFTLRAITFGLLVGLAQDSAIYYIKAGGSAFSHVNGWILSGGG